MMRIGIIREGKTPPDKRVPFTPQQCARIITGHPEVELVVQKSPIRAFDDEAYRAAGVELVDSLEDVDVVFGVKEVKYDDLLADKTYFFFSHTIKMQPYNRDLLNLILERNIRMVDYECLTAQKGNRLVGFGRYAGIVGCYNAFLAFGQRTGSYVLKAAHSCEDRKEMEAELPKISLPNNYKVALTGLGRVAGGAVEILTKMGVQGVSAADFLVKEFDSPVYTQLSVEDYFKKKDGSAFTMSEAYENSAAFDSDFFKFAQVADMYIPCHYWDSNGPFIFTKDDMQSPDFNIRTIADISCDIDGPVPSTIRPSTIADPIYELDRQTGKEVANSSSETITVMAVDNLPCELPKDASEDFGNELIRKILPSLLGEDSETIIERASIAANGDLMPNYEYLRAYVEGNE